MFRRAMSGGFGVALLAAIGSTSWTMDPEAIAMNALSVGGVWFAAVLLIESNRGIIDYFALRYAKYVSTHEIGKLRAINARLTAELEAKHRQIEDLMSDTPTSAVKVQGVARRMLADYYAYGHSMSYAECFRRGICSRADWDVVNGLLVRAGVKTRTGSVLAEDYTLAWAAFLEAYGRSKHYIRARDDSLVKGAGGINGDD